MIHDGLTAEEACALDWCLRQQQADWNATEAAELQRWLDASPLHAVAFLRMEHGLARVEHSLTEVGTPAASRPSPTLTAVRSAAPKAVTPPPAARGRWKALAWAASLALLLGGGALITAQLMIEPAGQYTTAVGSHRTVVLEDGSRVELNTDTRIRTVFEGDTRQVHLVRGRSSSTPTASALWSSALASRCAAMPSVCASSSLTAPCASTRWPCARTTSRHHR
jgi:transmembrane sensor